MTGALADIKSFSKKLPFIKKFIITLSFCLGFIGALTISSALANGTVPWTGQGTTNGTINTVQCSGDTATPGTMLWIFTLGGANTVTSATLTVNGTQYSGTQMGNEYHFITPWYTPDPNITTASVAFTGDLGNGSSQLTISHGCPPLTAKVTLTKTFEQGVFTTLPSEGDACFTIATNTGTSDTTQCSNTPEWDGLTPGTYSITESTTPSGYQTISPINFTVADDCTGVSGTCVETGNSAATSLGTFNDLLQPGHLRVVKLLGPAPGTAWTGANVTFYVCANNPISSSTELTPAQCNASTVGVVTLSAGASPADSGNLAEGYYTVCESIPSGYTVDDQCQVVSVEAGSVATDNVLTFINTPIQQAFWCSPGFWRNNAVNWGAGAWPVPTNTLYSSVINSPTITLSKQGQKAGATTNPTLLGVLAHPQWYGGASFNAVADYLATQMGWTGTHLTGENCPIDQHFIFPGAV